MRSRVILIRCDRYDEKEIGGLLSAALDRLGGIEAFLPDREAGILIKPNLLTKAAPERAVTTHYTVFGAVASVLRGAGYANLKYGDSPAIQYAGTDKVAEECMIAQTADKYGIPLADFTSGTEISFNGRTARSFVISAGALEADSIVNVCKLKTHMLERMTGAVKNLFGIVYGLNKGASHVKYPNPIDFARHLADLNLAYPPVLHVMDAVDAMEGNGPSGGTPRHVGMLLVSKDPVAVDTVACTLIGLDPLLVPTNRISAEYGVGICDTDSIDIELLDNGSFSELSFPELSRRFAVADFDVYRGKEEKGSIRYLDLFRPLIRKRPAIDASKCVGCGVCVRSCPVDGKAIRFPEKPSGKRVPEYNYKKCISCFCCQETCPNHAIYSKTTALAKLLDRKWKL